MASRFCRYGHKVNIAGVRFNYICPIQCMQRHKTQAWTGRQLWQVQQLTEWQPENQDAVLEVTHKFVPVATETLESWSNESLIIYFVASTKKLTDVTGDPLETGLPFTKTFYCNSKRQWHLICQKASGQRLPRGTPRFQVSYDATLIYFAHLILSYNIIIYTHFAMMNLVCLFMRAFCVGRRSRCHLLKCLLSII